MRGKAGLRSREVCCTVADSERGRCACRGRRGGRWGSDLLVRALYVSWRMTDTVKKGAARKDIERYNKEIRMGFGLGRVEGNTYLAKHRYPHRSLHNTPV